MTPWPVRYHNGMTSEAKNDLPFVACPLCGAPYGDADRTHMATHHGAAWFHAVCGVCSRAVFFSFAQNGIHAVTAGILTDCSREDLGRLVPGEKVTVDDVIAVHDVLARVGKLEG